MQDICWICVKLRLQKVPLSCVRSLKENAYNDALYSNDEFALRLMHGRAELLSDTCQKKF